ncbi:MAG TPA: hypothetical protein VII33_08765, partial [Nakamurella sp.]
PGTQTEISDSTDRRRKARKASVRSEGAAEGTWQGEAFIRRGTIGDARSLAALFNDAYPNSSHPFQSADDVEAFLADDRNFQVLVQADERIVAGAAMTHTSWNDSYELGRAISRRRGWAPCCWSFPTVR